MRHAISVLPVEPASRDAFVEAAAFEKSKYESFVPTLAKRLNTIHGLNKSEAFWDKVVGLTLLMHISNCRRIWAVGQFATAGEFEFSLLAPSCFQTPSDESSHRAYYQYSELGEEQLFSAYMQLHAPPNRYLQFVTSAESAAGSRERTAGFVAVMGRHVRNLAARLREDRGWLVREALVSSLKPVSRPTLLVTKCFWAPRAKQTIQLRGRGSIVVDDREVSYPKRAPEIDSPSRELIAARPNSSDDFDAFVFHTLRWAAPTSWIEDFPARVSQTELALATYPMLEYIANETLDEGTSLLMALGAERGIASLYCEHNYLQHQFVGNLVWFLLRKVDVYLSLGWSSPDSTKIVPAGSYFSWTAPESRTKSIELLFVASVSMVRPPLTSAGYGEAGVSAAGYFDMTQRFLSSLSTRTLSSIYYKDYPTERRAALSIHALETRLLEPFQARLGVVDRTGLESTASLVGRARLVVVNYLSTAYNQSLLAGVPTVVLFNPAAYYLTDQQTGFFDELIDAGVFQSDPRRAAAFVEEIMYDPTPWWLSEKVQKARGNYLRRNFGDPESLGSYLLRAARDARPNHRVRESLAAS
jgi:putative transferase (TIGR04331 family)